MVQFKKVFVGENDTDQLTGGVLTVTNTRITGTAEVPASIKILKTDGKDPLPGATFTLGNLGTAESNADGIVTFGNLTTVGSYSLTESSAPGGYDKSTETWYVEVTSGTDSAWKNNVFVTTTTYTATIYTDSGHQSPADLNNEGQLVIANTRQTGTLHLTKELAGNYNNYNFTKDFFTFDIKQGSTVIRTVNLPREVEGSLIWNVDVTDLPTDTYTVEEREPASIGAGYSSVATVTYPTGATAAVISNGETTNVTVTNTYSYTENAETFTATKIWYDNDDEFGLRPSSVSFALFDAAHNQIGTDLRVTTPVAGHGNEYTVTFTYDRNLYAPAYVEEVGYTDASGYHPFGEGLTSVPGYYEPDYQTESANTIVNELNTAILTLEKEFAGSTVNANPTFTIKGETFGYETTVSYNDFEGDYIDIVLPADTYTITESNADVGGYTRTTKWAVQGLIPQRSALVESEYLVFTDGMVATIELAGEDYVLFVNTYSPISYPPGSPEPSEPPETEIPETDSPLGPSPDTSPEPSEDPGIDIPEESGPLGPGPDTEIPDAETPVDAAPQTGDNSKTAPFAILAVLSALGLAALAFIGKKKKHE